MTKTTLIQGLLTTAALGLFAIILAMFDHLMRTGVLYSTC